MRQGLIEIQAAFIINALHLCAAVLGRATVSREALYITLTGRRRSLSLASHFRTSSTSSCGSSTVRRRAHEQTKKSGKIGEPGVVRHRLPALTTALATRAAVGSSADRTACFCGCRSTPAPR